MHARTSPLSRWSTLLLVVAVIALCVGGQSRVAASNGASIKAVGGGWVGFPPDTSRHLAQFSISAHTGPSGDFGSAQFSVTDEVAPLDVSSDIDCLNVFPVPTYHGGAWASGIVTRVDDPAGIWGISPGDRIYYFMLDGGEPSSLGPVDDFEPYYNIFASASCKLLSIPPNEFPDITSGNIVVDSPLDLP